MKQQFIAQIDRLKANRNRSSEQLIEQFFKMRSLMIAPRARKTAKNYIELVNHLNTVEILVLLRRFDLLCKLYHLRVIENLSLMECANKMNISLNSATHFWRCLKSTNCNILVDLQNNIIETLTGKY